MRRSDYDFDVISGPSTPPAETTPPPAPRPAPERADPPSVRHQAGAQDAAGEPRGAEG